MVRVVLGGRLEEALARQMEYAYFPLTLGQLGATVRYHDLVESTFTLEDVCITTHYLNHPALTLGYRLEADGVVLVYATDHEPHARPHPGPPGEPPGGALPVHQEDRRHIAFLRGADLIIHDAQYTAAEYAQKIGWGHSPVPYVVDVALAAHGKRLALFHHDPMRGDAELDAGTRAVPRAGCRRPDPPGHSRRSGGAMDRPIHTYCRARDRGLPHPTGACRRGASGGGPPGDGADRRR